MLQLGSFQFSIQSTAYQTLQRSIEYRWPAQDRFGKEPALQYVGPGPLPSPWMGLYTRSGGAAWGSWMPCAPWRRRASRRR